MVRADQSVQDVCRSNALLARCDQHGNAWAWYSPSGVVVSSSKKYKDRCDCSRFPRLNFLLARVREDPQKGRSLSEVNRGIIIIYNLTPRSQARSRCRENA